MLCLVGAVLLAGCVSDRQPEKAVQTAPAVNPTQAKAFAWARVDGQRMADNAELSAQAQADLTACKAETPPVAVVGVRGESCMKERGYYVRDLDR
jgi:hypothetical protein